VTVLDWADLTSDQRRLLTRGQLELDVGAEILNPDLTVAQDISEAVDNTSGDVHWLGSARIHRDVSINLALSTELAWGNTLLRVYRIVTDQATGLTARRNRGVFVLTAAPRPLGTRVFNPASRLFDQFAFTVTGQDRLALLNREVGYSYVQPMLDGGDPVTVVQAIANVYTACGITGYLIDGSRATAVLPNDMAWPLVPADDSSSTPLGAPTDPQLVAASGTGATTWLDILNDLNALITYQPTYCDESGYLRHMPYIDPATATPVDVFDVDEQGNIIDPDRTITRDLWAVPNQWIGIWANIPADGSGNPQTPTTANGGVYVAQNDDDGPSSVTALGGVPAGLRPKQFQVQAATSDDVAAQIEAQKASDMRTVTTISLQTTPYVAASHFDVFTYRDGGGLPPDLAPEVQVRAAEWTENFDNSNTEWTWETV
jgi:hypothetical protein